MRLIDVHSWRRHVLAAVLIASSALCVLWLGAAPRADMITLDTTVVEAVARSRPGWLVVAAVTLGTVGTPAVSIGLTVVVAVWVTWLRRAVWSVQLAAAGLCARGISDRGLKALVDRARPPQVLWAMPVRGASFPSGHAVFSAGESLLITAILATGRGR